MKDKILVQNEGDTVHGYVNKGGHYTNAITLYVDKKISVGSSMCLPTNADEAKDILICYVKAFSMADELLKSKTTEI